MTNEELNTALHAKMFAEQKQYRDWLLSQPPEEVLNHCYELVPVAYIKHKNPMWKKKSVCKYTSEGRQEIHKNLDIDTNTMLLLMRAKEVGRSVEYMDNRISLYVAQYGKCAITGKILELHEIHCHHKKVC